MASSAPIEIRRSGAWYAMNLAFAPITLGITLFLLFFGVGKWPRTVDQEGITLRNGMRAPWSQMTSAGWRKVGWYWHLTVCFGATEIAFIPAMMKDVRQVAAFMRDHLNLKLEGGPF